MAGPGGEHLPVVLGPELVEGRRDFDGLRKGLAVVIAAQVKATAIIDAKEKMDGSGLRISECDGIVNRYLAWLGQLLLDGGGIAFELAFEGNEVLAGQARFCAGG